MRILLFLNAKQKESSCTMKIAKYLEWPRDMAALIWDRLILGGFKRDVQEISIQ